MSRSSRLRPAALVLLAAAACVLPATVAVPAAGAAPKLRTYLPAGTPIKGRAAPADAPLLAPGRYVDTFDLAGESAESGGKYYRVALRKGDTPYFSATEVPPPRKPETGSVQVTLALKPVGDGVSGCSFSATGFSKTYGGYLNTVTAVLSPGPVGGPDWNDSCPTNGLYAVPVLRAGSAFPGETMPTEIAYRAEPSARSAGLPGAASPAANLQASAGGVPVPVTGGRGFGDAPLLATGTYRDTFASGETRYYRVHLDWGQRLAYTVTPDRDARIKDFDGASGHAALVSPLRQVLDQPDRARTDEQDLGATGDAMFGSTLVPVRYLNRTSDDSEVQAYAFDGDYYLALSTEYAAQDKPTVSVGYTLAVQVVGTKHRAPVYARGGPLPTSPDRSSGVPVVLIVVIGAGVGLLVLVGVLLRRRRRAARQARSRFADQPTLTVPPRY